MRLFHRWARTVVDVLLPRLYHPRIPSLVPSERLTTFKLARFVVVKCVVLIVMAELLEAPCLLQAQQQPISPEVYGQLKYQMKLEERLVTAGSLVQDQPDQSTIQPCA